MYRFKRFLLLEAWTLAAFPSTFFMCILEYRIEETLDGNGKMRINCKNAH